MRSTWTRLCSLCSYFTAASLITSATKSPCRWPTTFILKSLYDLDITFFGKPPTVVFHMISVLVCIAYHSLFCIDIQKFCRVAESIFCIYFSLLLIYFWRVFYWVDKTTIWMRRVPHMQRSEFRHETSVENAGRGGVACICVLACFTRCVTCPVRFALLFPIHRRCIQYAVVVNMFANVQRLP